MNKSKLAEEKLSRIIGELNSGKLFLTCGRHNYVAYRKPNGTSFQPPKPNGCPDCWRAYFFSEFAAAPPHTRYEQLQELEEVIHHTKEYIEKGKFDFVPDFNPTINYKKDGFDDVKGDYKPDIEITDMEKN